VLYPYPASIPIWQAASAAALLIIVTAWALRTVRTRPHVIVGWLWFLGTLVPVIGIVQVGSQPGYADRYMYIPATACSSSSPGRRRGLRWARPAWGPRLAAIGTVIVLASAAVTYRQIAHWKNDVTLWERDVAVTRDKLPGADQSRLCTGASRITRPSAGGLSGSAPSEPEVPKRRTTTSACC
jgi:hypothetical protein